MSPQFSIRLYQDQDASATITVFLRAIREVASRDYTPPQINAWAQVNDPIAWGQHRLSRPAWVAVHEDLVIGFGDLTLSGCLDMLFVHPDYQNLGVASQLLASIEEAARQLGLQKIDTEASLTARPFFERHGFSVVQQQSVLKRGQYLTNFMMTKQPAEAKCE